MSKKRVIELCVGFFAFACLVVSLGFCLAYSRDARGTSRVINYVGIVRGCTQRVVKLELAGLPADEQITYLDEVLDGLQNGGGEFDTVRIEDETFQNELSTERESWERLKEDIYSLRESPSDDAKAEVLSESEAYYSLCDKTVSVAESYSTELNARISAFEIVSAVNLMLLGAIFIHQLVFALASVRRASVLEGMAYIDSLTGTKSRGYFNTFASTYSSDRGYCLVYIDLDELKKVNDGQGHKAGDLYIQTCVKAIKAQFRATDVMFRLGGDEFALLLEGCTEEVATRSLERARADLAASSTEDVEYGFSFGIAYVPEGGNVTLDKALGEADEKMYAQKLMRKKGR